MDLLLPELLLMASLSFLLAFFLARFVASATPAPDSSSGDDRPLLHAAARDRVAAVDDAPGAAASGTAPGADREDELGEQREEVEPEAEQEEKPSSAAPPLVADSGLDDHRGQDGGRGWRDVEIVGLADQEDTELLPGLSSDEATGVLEPVDLDSQGEKPGVRQVHVTSARDPEVEDKPEPAAPIEEVRAGTTASATATGTTIAIATPGEGLLSEDAIRASDPGPRDEAEAESTAVEVCQVKDAIMPEEKGRFDSDVDSDDDDWEGIESSELGNLFSAASSFVTSPAGAEAVAKLPADVQLKLHGLHKAATEGPCYEAQPMPLKIAARAKWHAWQKLGDMNPEVAMEQYIGVLSERVPEWMVEKPGEESAQGKPSNSSKQSQLLREIKSRKPALN